MTAMQKRIVSWFSCGAASAAATKIAVDTFDDVSIFYCDTLAFEHPDNLRFMRQCEAWFDTGIRLVRSEKYTDIFDVFRKTRWLVGAKGARCTTELKREVRKATQRPGDIQVFGFTYDEMHRVDRFYRENPEVDAWFPLIEQKLTKRDCFEMVRDAGVEMPAMYRLGYKNNNCIGCVKGQQGYWNKIRRDFPEAFERMAAMERELDAAINKKYVKGKRIRVFLDELDPNAGRYDEEPDISCGVVCMNPADEAEAGYV